MLLGSSGQPDHVGLHCDEPVFVQDFPVIVKLPSIDPGGGGGGRGGGCGSRRFGLLVVLAPQCRESLPQTYAPTHTDPANPREQSEIFKNPQGRQGSSPCIWEAGCGGQ